jgi:pantoate--beta-alanine ligase
MKLLFMLQLLKIFMKEIPFHNHFDYDGLRKSNGRKFRPGHFDGVGTIVKRLFEIVKPKMLILAKKIFNNYKL